ncbi:MAG: phosphatidate cytidylyltransferase [Lachnospiraceae bacterium]|nr:phosphatidate cytidylyltransferase [Lachnospiraceae bacterium]
MFKTRLISGIILIVLALATILPGGLPLLLMVGFISVVGMLEFYGAMNVIRRNKAQIPAAGKEYEAKDPNALKSQVKEPMNALAAAGLVGAVNYLVLIAYAPKPYYLFGVVGTLTLLLAVYVFTFPRFHADQVVAAFAGMVYVAVTLGFIYLTRMAYDGHVLVWLIFLSSWGADTCAYCVGRLLGRHKMTPILSPKKSVEGAVGGVLGAGLLGLAYGSYLGRQGWIYFLICSVGALISMVGDLAASGIKRDKGIKDYGDLIPGHGGILDRFDSVIFTAPVIYFLSILLIRV